MKPFPHLVLFTVVAGACALPFSVAAAGTLLFAASIGAIISIDYSQRYRGLRMPRRVIGAEAPAKRRTTFHAPPLCVEPNQLAA